MATNMDKSLDEILGEQKPRRNNRSNDRRRKDSSNYNDNRSNRRRDNYDYPRDGVKKGNYRDEHRDLDSEWVHDRYEDNGRRGHDHHRRRDSPDLITHSDARGTRIRVDNIHYDLTEDELRGLFSRIGPVVRFQLRYDRAGRSEGVAFVTYDRFSDAKKAVTEFDGANANGQPISLTIVSSESTSRRNPFDTAVMPGRSLADRIADPRDRSKSPRRHIEDEDASSLGIDRYIPGRNNRSRSPLPRRRQGGRHPGERRQNNRNGSRNPRENSKRPQVTAKELDAEMDSYFGGTGEKYANAAAATETPVMMTAPLTDDVDMIE